MEIIDDILHLVGRWDAEATEMENQFKHPGGDYSNKLETLAYFTALRRAATDVRKVLVHQGFAGKYRKGPT